MKIKNNFTQKEIELLENINVNIEDRDYTEQEILILSKNIYKNGYHDTNITYGIKIDFGHESVDMV